MQNRRLYTIDVDVKQLNNNRYDVCAVQRRTLDSPSQFFFFNLAYLLAYIIFFVAVAP